jgi:hypothetical protein
MRLSARAIVNYANINSFSYVNQWIVNSGDPLMLYFQLVDLDQGPYAVIGTPYNILGQNSQLSGNVGLRYIPGGSCPMIPGSCCPAPAAPIAVSVTFQSLSSASAFTAIATQASPLDGSIWVVSLAPSQQPYGGNVLFSVTECNGTKTFSVLNLLNVIFSGNEGCC